jgi:hypothetical protein
MRTILKILAGFISIGAGLYLLAHGSGSVDVGGQSGQSWFEILAHGIGIYFLAKGVWMLSHIGEAEYLVGQVEKLVALQAGAHVAETTRREDE